jgi:hypothetical protein
MSRLRVLAAIALSLLLVGTQHGARVHALEHDAKRLGHDQAALFAPGTDEGCSTCASFAGSSHAIPAGDCPLLIGRDCANHVRSTSQAFADAAPAYYQIRAPPCAPSTLV